MTPCEQIIFTFNQGRDPERLAMKLAKMQSSPFIFLRGACHLFYDRLPKDGIFKTAPATWLCGDLHFENFGSYKADDRQVYFDINDFDEACLGPCTWDLVRFLTSVLVGADSLGANQAESRQLSQTFVDAYAAALADGKPRWMGQETSQGLIRELLDAVVARKRAAFLDTRSDLAGRRRKLRIDGKKTLAATEDQKAQITAFIGDYANTQPNPEFFQVIDIARRIAGTGSLGVARYIILVEGRGSPNQNYFLDLKEALPSSLAPYLEQTTNPPWPSQAQRVVTVQKRSQAFSMAFLQAVERESRSYILRGLLASEDRVALDPLKPRKNRLTELLQSFGQIVAWAHLRGAGRQGAAPLEALIGFASQSGWKKDLLDAAEDAAAATVKDWRAYSQALQDGYFAPLLR